jgi:Kef-type K+ transport system membrane component KefB
MLAVFVLIFPAVLAVIATVVILLAVRAVLAKRYGQFSNQQVKVQVILLILTVAAVPIVVLTLPLSETQQGQLIGLVGILVSAAIALAATTFLGNALAGLMLRSVGSFCRDSDRRP